MPLTASTSPAGVMKLTPRSRTARTGAASVVTGIESVAQRVAKEVERHEQHDQHARRRDQHPGCRFHVPRTLVDQAPEAGKWLLYAEAEKAEKAFVQDHLRNRQRRVH